MAQYRVAFYDGEDVARRFIRDDEAGYLAEIAALPVTDPAWTWRVLAFNAGPGGERWAVKPEVVSLEAVGPLSTYRKPDNAPR